MQFFYGNLLDSVQYFEENIKEFSQPDALGFAETGYAYVPEYCAQKECSIHF